MNVQQQIKDGDTVTILQGHGIYDGETATVIEAENVAGVLVRLDNEVTRGNGQYFFVAPENLTQQVTYRKSLYQNNETYREYIDRANTIPDQIAKWNDLAEKSVMFVDNNMANFAVIFERQRYDESANANFSGIPGLSEKGILMLQLSMELQMAYLTEEGIDGHFSFGVCLKDDE